MKPSPRPDLRSRLQNRLLHKFVWMPKTMGMLGCVGCGRCIVWCPVGIDITEEARAIRDTDGGT